LTRPPLPPLPKGGRNGAEPCGLGRYRLAWLVGGLLSVLALTLVAIDVAHSRLSQQPAVFAEVHVDAPLLKLVAGSPDDFEDDLQTHAGFITKKGLLSACLRRPEIAHLGMVQFAAPDGLRWLAGHVRVECRGPKTLRILYTGKPSPEAATLVNGIAATYIDEMLDLTSRLRVERIEELERAQRDIQHRLGEKREAISRLGKLLASGESLSDQEMVGIWTSELDLLKKAILEGEEIDGRITAELTKLRNPPHEAAVGLLRPAEF